jgi:hypothetical protein
LIQAREPGGRDADDGELDAVETYRAANDGAIGAELPLPEIVAEHHHGVAAGHLILVGPEGAPQLGLHADHRKEVAGHQHADRLPRRGAGPGVECHDVLFERDQPFEAPAAIPHVHVIAIRRAQDRPDRGGGGRTDRKHLGGARHSERPEQERVGKAEHRAVGADADCKRDDRHRREARIFGEHAAAVAQVAREIVEPGQPALIAHRLHRLRDAAGLERGCASRRVGRRAAALRILGRELHMQPQLLFEVAVGAAATERAPEPDDPFAERDHAIPPPFDDAHDEAQGRPFDEARGTVTEGREAACA